MKLILVLGLANWKWIRSYVNYRSVTWPGWRNNLLSPSIKSNLWKRFRSSHPGVFFEKGVLEICSKFTGKHPCRSVISIKLLCRTPFTKNTSRWLLLKVSNSYQKQKLLYDVIGHPPSHFQDLPPPTSDTYSKPSQTSKIDPSAKTVKD